MSLKYSIYKTDASGNIQSGHPIDLDIVAVDNNSLSYHISEIHFSDYNDGESDRPHLIWEKTLPEDITGMEWPWFIDTTNNVSHTVPLNGSYKFLVAGGGGGGAAWWRTHHDAHSEASGGKGGLSTIILNSLVANRDSVTTIQVGKGGTADTHLGGNGGTNGGTSSNSGGTTKFSATINGVTYDVAESKGGGSGYAKGSTTRTGSTGKSTVNPPAINAGKTSTIYSMPRVLIYPYITSLVLFIKDALANSNTTTPTSNKNSYAGTTFKKYYDNNLSTFEKYVKSLGTTPLSNVIDASSANIAKIVSGWNTFSDIINNSSKYVANVKTNSIFSTTTKTVTNPSLKMLVKDSTTKVYSSSIVEFYDLYGVETVYNDVISKNGINNNLGLGGGASKRSASSGNKGAVIGLYMT